MEIVIISCGCCESAFDKKKRSEIKKQIESTLHDKPKESGN